MTSLFLFSYRYVIENDLLLCLHDKDLRLTYIKRYNNMINASDACESFI